MGKKHRERETSRPCLHDCEVVLTTGGIIKVTAHFGFDNDSEGRGLTFRRYHQGDEGKTYVAAQFARGSWTHYSEVPKQAAES